MKLAMITFLAAAVGSAVASTNSCVHEECKDWDCDKWCECFDETKASVYTANSCDSEDGDMCDCPGWSPANAPVVVAPVVVAPQATPAPVVDSSFYCTNGPGGDCYEASTSCFGSCPSMGNWKASKGYEGSYSSFQTFCASWSANSGTFNGGTGTCPSATPAPVVVAPVDSSFHCTSGRGGTCYEASTSCFGSCPSMGNWKASNGYEGSYSSFQTFCASWSANRGTFNGGTGACPSAVTAVCVSCSGSGNVGGYWGTYTGLTKGFATYGPFTCMEGVSDGLLTFRGHGSCP